MLTESIAKRYAKALFNIAIERKILDQVEADIIYVMNAVSSEKRLYEILISPRLPAKAKKNLLLAVFSGISEVTRNFLFLLMDKRRETLLSDVVSQYKLLLDEHRKIQQVCVVSAEPVPSVVTESLTKKLEQALNKKIVLHLKEDPDILGGLIIQIGDVRIDGSIKHKLEQLKEQLVSASV